MPGVIGGVLVAQVEPRTGWTVVRPPTEVDLASAPQLREDLLRAVAQNTDLLVDLSAVRFIDATGIDLLLQARRRLAVQGHRVAIAAPNALVERALRAAGAWDLFEAESPAP
jgi:anti-anti-sigma factor